MKQETIAVHGGYDVDVKAMQSGAADFLAKNELTPLHASSTPTTPVLLTFSQGKNSSFFAVEGATTTGVDQIPPPLVERATCTRIHLVVVL